LRRLALSWALFTTIPITASAETGDPVPGRVTAIAPVIWACPLEAWRLRQDDACDPIETGTSIKILQRGVKPDYPHGPFAQIEYSIKGATKIQYVIDNTVTPLGEDDPSIEEIIEREKSR
jgi:hypothetical protein